MQFDRDICTCQNVILRIPDSIAEDVNGAV